MNISPLLFCQYKIYTPLSRLLVQIYNFSRDETQGDLKKKVSQLCFFTKSIVVFVAKESTGAIVEYYQWDV